MKNFSYLLYVLFFVIACGSDDSTEDDIIDVTTALDPNLVSNGMSIDDAQLIQGSAPTPNTEIAFILDSTSSALVNSGFEIGIETQETIAGAYLIIADQEGNQANSYFDIDVSAIRAPIVPTRNPFNLRQTRMTDGSIAINFDNTIPAGIFCYQICLYTINGNVGQPQTVCVTVLPIGGNSTLAGDWNLSRYQYKYLNQSSFIEGDVGLNEEYCDPETISCVNGATLNTENCSTIDSFSIQFFNDGDYILEETDRYTALDYNASVQICETVFDDEVQYGFISRGTWAYNSTNDTLTLYQTEAEYYTNGVLDGSYPENDILYDDTIQLSSNQFLLTFTYEDEPDGDEDFDIYTFEK